MLVFRRVSPWTFLGLYTHRNLSEKCEPDHWSWLSSLRFCCCENLFWCSSCRETTYHPSKVWCGDYYWEKGQRKIYIYMYICGPSIWMSDGKKFQKHCSHLIFRGRFIPLNPKNKLHWHSPPKVFRFRAFLSLAAEWTPWNKKVGKLFVPVHMY